MKYLKRYIFFSFLIVISFSCGNKFFVRKDLIINKEIGIVVFIDRDTQKNRHFGEGDVFTAKDSLLPDFFIPTKFAKKVITKQDIVNTLSLDKSHDSYFFNLIRDCNEVDRQSSIERDCLSITLDTTIDEYLKSKNIYILPAEIYFIYSPFGKDYSEIHSSISLILNKKDIEINFQHRNYDIFRMDVLEHEW
jgi:hypothetical protein